MKYLVTIFLLSVASISYSQDDIYTQPFKEIIKETQTSHTMFSCDGRTVDICKGIYTPSPHVKLILGENKQEYICVRTIDEMVHNVHCRIIIVRRKK